jgi:hypothetical protein
VQEAMPAMLEVDFNLGIRNLEEDRRKINTKRILRKTSDPRQNIPRQLLEYKSFVITHTRLPQPRQVVIYWL